MLNQKQIKRKTTVPKKAAAREKKPMGRPPVGNYLTQFNVRCTQESFEQIEFIKSGGGHLTHADAIRHAIRNEAVRHGWQPKKPGA